MALTLSDWQSFRSRLWEARASGVREVRDQNGEAVVYRSDSELAAAIAAVDSEIRRLHTNPPNTILFQTSKGI